VHLFLSLTLIFSHLKAIEFALLQFASDFTANYFNGQGRVTIGPFIYSLTVCVCVSLSGNNFSTK